MLSAVEMAEKLASHTMPSGFILVKMPATELKEDVLSIRMETLDVARGPLVVRSLTIYQDLRYQMHVSGREMSTSATAHLVRNTERFQTTSEVLNVLAFLKAQPLEECTMTSCLELLQKLAEDDTTDCRVFSVFAVEQLRLRTCPRTARKYSPSLLGTAVIWSRTSPQLYEELRNSGLFILPHRSTLRRLTSALSVQEGLEIGTMKYLQMRNAKLTPRERIVNLAMDEVYCAPTLELAGGRLHGESSDGSGKATTTLFCTHISSVAGRYEDLVTMSPVAHVTTQEMVKMFFNVVKGLTELGFRVVSVTTDGHRTNQSFHRALGDGTHPEYIVNPWSSDGLGRIYTMFDTVHLFKNIFFNLLNKKTLLCPPFEETGAALTVKACHLEKLHRMEFGSPVKMAYRLSDKVLNPTSVERVNVKLADSATHETTIAGLMVYSKEPGCDGFADTAEFLKIVRTWFNIVNVKSPYKHVAKRDDLLKPICLENEDGLKYLEKFGALMEDWDRQPGTAKISSDTLRGLVLTCRGLVGLSKYLLQECDLEYVLLGKIQSDRIEGHFGHLRKLAGGNFWASPRQFTEGEAIIRAKSLLWLSGYTPDEVAVDMRLVTQQREENDHRVATELTQIAAESLPAEEGPEEGKDAVFHMAGYLAHAVQKKHKCNPCRDLLADGHRKISVKIAVSGAEEQEAAATFTDLLNRGKLLQPSATCLQITEDICSIFRSLRVEAKTRAILFGCTNPRRVFKEISLNLLEEKEGSQLECAAGHKVSKFILPTMAGTLFNACVSNHAKDLNSLAHAEKRPKQAQGRAGRRNSDSDKIRKLTGSK